MDDKYVSGNKMVSAGDVDQSSGCFVLLLPEYAFVSALELEVTVVLFTFVLSFALSLFFFSENLMES